MNEKDGSSDQQYLEELLTTSKLSRRSLFKSAVTVGVGLVATGGLRTVLAQEAAETDLSKLPPQKGDGFVFAGQAKQGQLITTDDVPLGGPQVLAWPAEVDTSGATPTVKVVRDGNTQNAVLLARFDPSDYSVDTKGYVTATGVVAYAATCTHQCCQVTDWEADKKLFHCPCHGSEYNPLNHAQQTSSSPAPRPLPQLPLVADADASSVPTVASGFRTQVGCAPDAH